MKALNTSEYDIDHLDSGVLWYLTQYNGAALVGWANTKSGFVHLHQR